MYRKIPRSSFMVDPLGEAVTTSDADPAQSPPIMGPIRPIYVVSQPAQPVPMPPAAAAAPGPFSVNFNGKELPPIVGYVIWIGIGWSVYSGLKNALELFQRKVP